MIDITPFRQFLNPFGWFLSLGKGDVDHIKAEIQDLLHHSSQSLLGLIELSNVITEIPRDQFDQEHFLPIANHCYWYFTSDEGVQKTRTHCTDISRDVARINFAMARLLRTENMNWKGIDAAFEVLGNADDDFLVHYSEELRRIGKELDEILLLLDDGNRDQAWERYEALRKSLLGSKKALSNEIAKMQSAQTHIHELLT